MTDLKLQTSYRATQLYESGMISRLVLLAAKTSTAPSGPGAWTLTKRLRAATEIVNRRWSSYVPPAQMSHVERELTTDRLLAIRVVSTACGWKETNRLAVDALKGDESSKRKLRMMFRPQLVQGAA